MRFVGSKFSALLSLVGLAFFATATAFCAEEAEMRNIGQNTCTSSEKWKLNAGIPEDARVHFDTYLANHESSIVTFSHALALRKIANTPEVRTFSEYWLARSLFGSTLKHSAYQGFLSILREPVSAEVAPFQAAALNCLNEIFQSNPTMTLPPTVWKHMIELGAFTSRHISEPLQNAVAQLVLQELPRQKLTPEILQLIQNLPKKSAHAAFSQMIYAVHTQQYKKAVEWGNKLLTQTKMPDFLNRFKDSLYLLMGRSHYALKQYEQAIHYFKQVSKSSNMLAHSLTDLAWSYLQSDMLREAIGTSINLQSGTLRRTFSPESPMIMAMALNELCQYPESVRAISLFRRNYKNPYFWLTEWKHKGAPSDLLYKTTVQFLKSDKKAAAQFHVPPPVVIEWLRSPSFIARQDEINLLYDEQDASKKLGKEGSQEQALFASKLLHTIREVKKRYDATAIQLKPGQSLPVALQKDLDMLREQVLNYRKLRKAAPVWQRIMAAHTTRAPKLEVTLIQDINRDLRELTLYMHRTLENVAENNQLIEVEIYNGASQDIIWQNAHPDYADVAKDMKSEDQKAVDSSKTYNWGHTALGLEGTGEIWEDELGSFKADLYDNCNNKDRYLAIKLTPKQ